MNLDIPTSKVVLDAGLAFLCAIGVDLLTKRRMLRWLKENFGNPMPPPKPYTPPIKRTKREEKKIVQRTEKEMKKMEKFYDNENLNICSGVSGFIMPYSHCVSGVYHVKPDEKI